MASADRTDLPVLFETPIQFPLIPENWSYDESVKSIQPKLGQWKKFTIEIASELYVAQKSLSQPGRRTDLVPRETRLPTFEEYCDEIGIGKTTAYRWIKSVFGIQLLEVEQQESSPAVDGHAPVCPHCGSNQFQTTIIYMGDAHLCIKDLYCCGCGVKIDITDDMIKYADETEFVVQWPKRLNPEDEELDELNEPLSIPTSHKSSI